MTFTYSIMIITVIIHPERNTEEYDNKLLMKNSKKEQTKKWTWERTKTNKIDSSCTNHTYIFHNDLYIYLLSRGKHLRVRQKVVDEKFKRKDKWKNGHESEPK